MNYILREVLDILKRGANWKRLPNALLTMMSYSITKTTGHHIRWGYPFMLMIEPTNICNLRCPLCITGSKLMTRDDGLMDIDRFKRLIDEMSPYVMHLTLWSQGEPFVNRKFCDMVEYASSKGMKTMTSTNGHFLTDNAERIVRSGLDTLIVAVDGATQETYEKYRVNGKFEKVYNGLKAVAEQKKKLKSKTPEIELQFIVMKHNEHEEGRIRELARETGVQVLSFKTAQVYTAEQALEFLPENEKYRRYELTAVGEIKTKITERNFCRWVMLCPVINWDGTVSPCCFDKNADYPLGNVFNDGGMKAVWKGKRYAEFRQQILKRRRDIPICTNCSEGLEVDVFDKELISDLPLSQEAENSYEKESALQETGS